MAEGDQAMTNPPGLAANDQSAVASDLMKGDISGDITSVSKRSAGPQAEVGEGQQQNIQTSLGAERQRLQQIQRAEAKLTGEGAGAEAGGKLFGGITGVILQKIPGVGMLINRFKKSADLESKIKTLEKMKRRLKLAKTTAAIVDAIRRWSEAVAASSETIVIPIFLVIGFIPWVMFSVIFDLGPTAKTINQVTKKADKTLSMLKKLVQQNAQRKAALNDLRGAEISAAREQVENAA